MAILLLLIPAVPTLQGADSGGRVDEALQEGSAVVEQAGATAAETAREIWRRIDDARLKNRTPDELVAWVVIGILVGALAGMGTDLKSTLSGKLGRLALGLAGAFLGGIVVRLGQFDFGWGPVLIRYEEVFFSLIGAILIVVLAKFMRTGSKTKGKPAQ